MFDGDRGKTLAVLTDTAETAEPHVAGGILEDIDDLVVHQPVIDAEGHENIFFQATDAAHGGDPDAALPILGEGADDLMAQAIRHLEPAPRVPLMHHEPVIGTQPHPTLTVHQYRLDLVECILFGLRPVFHLAVVNSRHAAGAADPETAVAVLGQGQHLLLRQLRNVYGAQAPVVVIDRQPGLVSDPQMTVLPHQQIVDIDPG